MIRPRSKKWWWAIVAALLLVFIAVIFDPPWTLVGRNAGTVIAGAPQVLYDTTRASLSVRLPNGHIIVALAQADCHHPFHAGDFVLVVTYQTLIFRRAHYEVSYPNGC